MVTLFRTVVGVIAGALVALILLIAVELFSAVVHPFPADFQHTTEQMCQHVARYPQWVLAVVVPIWGLTAFVSTWIALRIGGFGTALFIGLLLVAAVVFNLSMLPYPIWFKVVNPLVILAAVILACRLPIRNRVTVGGTS